MSWLNDRRVLAGLGGAVVLVVAVGAASLLSRSPRTPEATSPANTTESSNITGSAAGGLKVEMGKAPKVEADTSVRCFVKGQFVGMQSAADCAQKNGVAPGALDVGVDQSGALAAGAGDTPLQPLSNALDNETDQGDGDADADGNAPAVARTGGQAGARSDGDDAAAGIGQVGDCLRFGRAGWRDAGRGVTLNACVHAVFDGRCVAQGQAVFGRWGDETLRLTPGRVAIASDNRTFRPLLPQDPADCALSPG